MQQQDLRNPGQQTQFPPPGYQPQPGGMVQPVPAHLAPEHYGQQLADEAQRNDGAANSDFRDVYEDQPGEYTDYFGFSESFRYMMPDRRQWIEFKTLTEGDIAEYQKLLNRDVTVEKATGNARIKINQVEERHALLQVAVIGWHMVKRDPKRNNEFFEMPFGNKTPHDPFMKWVKVANPELVADLDETIRKKNPALLAANTETLEQVDKQIADLTEQRDRILERMAGNAASATS